MTKFILTMLALITMHATTIAQDMITRKTGEEIMAKILEVNLTEIKYKKFDNPDGPTFTVLKSEVFMIKYENGTKDMFNQIEQDTEGKKTSGEDMRSKGKKDALMNYKGKNSGAGWTAAATVVFSPLIGVIPAAACASAEPAEENLNYRDPELMKDFEYNKAYVEQAHKTKKNKIWKSFGISSGAWLLLVLLL